MEPRAYSRTRLAILSVRFTMYLIGPSVMQPREFASYKPRIMVRPSITAIAPTDLYDPARLINLISFSIIKEPL